MVGELNHILSKQRVVGSSQGIVGLHSIVRNGPAVWHGWLQEMEAQISGD